MGPLDLINRKELRPKGDRIMDNPFSRRKTESSRILFANYHKYRCLQPSGICEAFKHSQLDHQNPAHDPEFFFVVAIRQ